MYTPFYHLQIYYFLYNGQIKTLIFPRISLRCIRGYRWVIPLGFKVLRLLKNYETLVLLLNKKNTKSTIKHTSRNFSHCRKKRPHLNPLLKREDFASVQFYDTFFNNKPHAANNKPQITVALTNRSLSHCRGKVWIGV